LELIKVPGGTTCRPMAAAIERKDLMGGKISSVVMHGAKIYNSY